MNITWIGSPNCGHWNGKALVHNRDGAKVDKFVIHWMDGTLSGTDAQFRKDGSRLPFPGTSAHFGVEDDTIHQYVKMDDIAWHAHKFEVNQTSIGIEHSADPYRPASDATYVTSGQLIAQLCHQLGLVPSRGLLHRHSEYYNTTCCGTMDLDRLAAEAWNAWLAIGADQPIIQTPSGSVVATGTLTSAPVPPPAPTPVIITFSVTVNVPVANFRTGPHLTSPVARQYPRGTVIECDATVTGDSVGGNDRWYKSTLHGYYISATVATHN